MAYATPEPTIYDRANLQQIMTGLDPVHQMVARREAQLLADQELARRVFAQNQTEQLRSRSDAQRQKELYGLIKTRDEQQSTREDDRLKRQYGLIDDRDKKKFDQDEAIRKEKIGVIQGNSKARNAHIKNLRDKVETLQTVEMSKVNAAAQRMAQASVVNNLNLPMKVREILVEHGYAKGIELVDVKDKPLLASALVEEQAKALAGGARAFADPAVLKQISDLDFEIKDTIRANDNELNIASALGADLSGSYAMDGMIGPPPPPGGAAPGGYQKPPPADRVLGLGSPKVTDDSTGSKFGSGWDNLKKFLLGVEDYVPLKDPSGEALSRAIFGANSTFGNGGFGAMSVGPPLESRPYRPLPDSMLGVVAEDFNPLKHFRPTGDIPNTFMTLPNGKVVPRLNESISTEMSNIFRVNPNVTVGSPYGPVKTGYFDQKPIISQSDEDKRITEKALEILRVNRAVQSPYGPVTTDYFNR